MVGVEALAIIIAIVVSYLLGSIPSAYIAGRLVKGVDIRQVGGGNVGALNVIREIGTVAGVAVLIADVAKGFLAVVIAQWLGVSLVFVFVAGLVAVAGHNWPVFLGFQGGMGAATTMGVLLALVPLEFAISFGIIVMVVLVTNNVRLGIGVGLVFLPLIIWLFGGAGSLIVYSVVLFLFAVLRSLPAIKDTLTSASSKKDLIFDKQFKPWQRRK